MAAVLYFLFWFRQQPCFTLKIGSTKILVAFSFFMPFHGCCFSLLCFGIQRTSSKLAFIAILFTLSQQHEVVAFYFLTDRKATGTIALIGVETAKGDSYDGPTGPKHGPRESCDLPPLLSSSYPITVKFMDVGYRVKIENKKQGGNTMKRIFTPRNSSLSDHGSTVSTVHERTILNGITGMVSPGEILAILGPSGSEKSMLLNALAGRLHGHGLTGTIQTNESKLSRPVLKRTGFMTQDDVLYPHLTVRETLIFYSLLRLPRTLSRKEKVSMAESVITELGLVKCQNTIIGNNFICGVSGEERKRVNIAHEMLINPSLLILDKSTSGLDSTAAHRLVMTLGTLAQKGKTVVMSMHQPSSRIYQMFDAMLVLSKGQCLYFEKGSEAMSYFETIGFIPSFPMNPTDFLLDLVNDEV